jgi:hypothetical protein
MFVLLFVLALLVIAAIVGAICVMQADGLGRRPDIPGYDTRQPDRDIAGRYSTRW